jgi:hypothetical protein
LHSEDESFFKALGYYYFIFFSSPFVSFFYIYKLKKKKNKIKIKSLARRQLGRPGIKKNPRQHKAHPPIPGDKKINFGLHTNIKPTFFFADGMMNPPFPFLFLI